MIRERRKLSKTMSFFDMKQAVRILENEWDLGKTSSGAKGSICAWIYLISTLKISEQILVYKVKGSLVGFCGYSLSCPNPKGIKRKLYGYLENILLNSGKIKDKNALEVYNDNYDYCPEELNKEFDGEISILIVSPEYRGQGIGRKLLTEIFNIAKSNGLKNLQILSDESCNYSFYEAVGCVKVYETTVVNKEPLKLKGLTHEKAYVFKKCLNHPII